jgi:hypothetical protein
MKKNRVLLKRQIYKLPLLLAVVLIALVGLMPVLLPGHADAYGQITRRSLTISSGVPSKTGVKYTFTFDLATAAPAQSLKFIACNSAVQTYPGNTGTCVPPTGLDFSSAVFDSGSFSGWQGATNFTAGAGSNDCTAAANVICATRSDNTAQTPGSPNHHTIAFNTIINPSTPNTAFYVGIHTYNDVAYTAANRVDFGATASAVVQTLTTNAAVAEVLNFCIGSTTIDDTTTLIATDCTTLTGTSINLGTLDVSQVNISPWTTDGGDSQNAVAMVRSNAGNGVVVDYDAIQQSGSNHLGTLRISGQTCSLASGPGLGSPPAASGPYTDPCIDSAGPTQNVITPSNEEFGMTIAGVNGGSSTSYTCTYLAGPSTCNLEPQTNYMGAGAPLTEAYGTTNGFAWQEDGTFTTIASSAASTVKQVDDEALVLKYAATPAITTPFGPYAAQTDFIAVPTY